MDSGEWIFIKGVFSEAVELPAEQQEQFVKNTCQGNVMHEKKILEMILAESNGDKNNFLNEAVSSQVTSLLNEQFGVDLGSRVGAYKIESQIGQGGMGKVYLASRADNSFQQQVAIKIIDSQSVSQQSIQRFEIERQILANLEHSNIARLIDGGTTENGLPYIVMEYVIGTSLADYCQSKNKSLEERLQLFSQVANAITYAHQNLVIHRDIKPSNILVTESGEVKLLDFGIAKLLVENEEQDPDITQEQHRLFTPSNASPEQLTGQPITTRTDVYELGALLYHLLTDKPLFDIESEIRVELEKAIIEKTPQKPSVQAKLISKNNIRSKNALSHKIQSDLDTITLKALKKDPQRRYQSAKELVADIERYLDNYPILARPDSVFYRMKKFAKRNMALSTSLAVSTVSIIAFILVISEQNIEIEKQKQAAVGEALVANHVVDFMIEIFNNANPEKHQGNFLSASDLLQAASESLEDLTQSDLIKNRLSITIGRSFQKMGKYKDALPLIEESIVRNTAESESEAQQRMLAKNLYFLGDLYTELVEDEKAVDVLRESIAIYVALYDKYQQQEDEIGMSFPLVSLGSTLSILGKFEEAKQVDLQALEITIRHLGKDDFTVGEIYNSLGHVYRNLGKFENALDALKKGLSIVRKAQGEDTLQSAHSLNQLASTLLKLERYQEALPLAKEGLAIRERIHQGAHPEIAASLGMVANLLVRLKKIDEAILYRKKSINILRGIFGDEHAYVGMSLGALGGILFVKGDTDEAQSIYRQALIVLRNALPAGNVNIVATLNGLGKIDNLAGIYKSAKDFNDEAYRIRKSEMPAGHWKIGVSAELLADSLLGLGEISKAKKLFLEAKDILSNAYDDEDKRVIRIKEKLNALPK